MLIKRKTKHLINFQQLIQFNSMYIHSFSYTNAASIIEIESGKYYSENAFNKKRANMNIDILENFNVNLLKMIYEPSDVRYIACDGSVFVFGSGLIDEGYACDMNISQDKPSKYDSYAKGRVSGMIDINSSIPINYLISNGYSKESELICQQFKYLNKGDVLIFDRGYYSKSFLKKLNDNGFNYIFRMRENSKLFSELTEDSKIITFNGIKNKILKYSVDNNNYYLLTSLIDKSDEFLKNLYRKRWIVETDFKKIKYDILFNEIRSRTDKQVNIDIKTINFISILTGYINKLIQQPGNRKINNKNSIDIVIRFLLKLLLSDSKTNKIIKKIEIIFNIITKHVTYIVDNRSYPRQRKKPSTKWNAIGNRYKKK